MAEKVIHDNIMVSICCITYNHEKFIRQCLDGFLMQKVNFPIEILIHDDASTDNTQSIIREYENIYPDIIKPIYQKENQYSKGVKISLTYQYPRAKGRYIAICEGDDYWTDPYKLQKQVDFLEKHSDYGLVHTKMRFYVQKDNKYLSEEGGRDFSNFDELLLFDRIATLTTCFRACYVKTYPKDITIDPSWKMGDYPLWLYIGMHSKIFFLNEVTSTYRVLENSASHSKDLYKQVNFILSSFSVQSYFMKKTHKEYLHREIARMLFTWILNLYIDYNENVDFQYYKNKLKIKSLGFWFEFKCRLRLIKHLNYGFLRKLKIKRVD